MGTLAVRPCTTEIVREALLAGAGEIIINGRRTTLEPVSDPTTNILPCGDCDIDMQSAQVYSFDGRPWGLPDGKIGNLMPIAAYMYNKTLLALNPVVEVYVVRVDFTENDILDAGTRVRLVLLGLKPISKEPIALVVLDQRRGTNLLFAPLDRLDLAVEIV